MDVALYEIHQHHQMMIRLLRMTKQVAIMSLERYLHSMPHFILFAYTAKNKRQPTHKGDGMLPRTCLVLFGIVGLLPLVLNTDV